MKIVVFIAKLYLLMVIFFGWGLVAARFELFPYAYVKPTLDQIAAFVKGGLGEETSLVDKLMHDADIAPERFMRVYAPKHGHDLHPTETKGLRDRREMPRVWIAPSTPPRYRLITGAFDFEKGLWGALLLDPSGKVLHEWPLRSQIGDFTREPNLHDNLYGIAFFEDGSAIFTMQERSEGLVKVDYCGDPVWTKRGKFHHVVQPTADKQAFWTLGGGQSDLHPKVILVDVATGETLKTIDMTAVQTANPDTFIFDLRPEEEMHGAHPTHSNHVEPLPPELAAAFPQFSAGDLVISYHTTNLIFVLDPESLKIKWWYMGAGDAQHDPDWLADGTISIFNNNRRARWRNVPRYSSIVAIDPQRNKHQVVIHGEDFHFYSAVNGHHLMTEDGTILITSSMQGRVFEVDPATQEMLFEFVNAYEWDEGRTLHLSETFVIPEETVQQWLAQDCAAGR
ncbi:MAG: arylsulfotransferase family protein [Magnetospiraceae bacterium]